MARSTEPEEEIWGTWEELILACLVKRHGPHSWESIASEIRSRSPYAHRLTADTCKSRFLLLKNRFTGGDGTNGGDPIDESNESESTVEIPWLDELKKLRVDQLRQEVQRHDISIGSLQLKVNKLKEERENGSGSESGHDPKEKKIQKQDSGRSCKESNTTETKAEEKTKDVNNVKEETDQGLNGSRSGSVNADPTRNGNGNGNESSDSVGESKEVKEGSDVQSTASRQRRSDGRRISTIDKMDEVKSQPLIEFLERVRSSKDGLVFDRRLESQESLRYRSMIRRHVDFEMMRNRIGTVGYTSAEFYRDLLLLCNNAIVFYSKNSPESISAVHLRRLVNKEISAKLLKTSQASPQLPKEPTPPPQAVDIKPKVGVGPVEKPALSASLVACRKRSTIGGKTAKPAKKVEKEDAENEEKEEETKEEEEEDDDDDDEEEDGEEEEEEEEEVVLDKKSTKSRGLRTNKTRAMGKGGENVAVAKKPSGVLKPDPVEQEMKSSKVKKRGSPATFLSRMKNSPPSSSIGRASGNAKSTEGKRKAKEETKKRERESIATKRNVGRPPKRGAKRAREESTPPPLPKKRGRR